jgi:ribosomal protein S18 acetylase RimI-like enzyme
MNRCIEHVKALGMRQVSLEVAKENTPAIKLYEKSGFAVGRANAPFVSMHLYLKNGEEHE